MTLPSACRNLSFCVRSFVSTSPFLSSFAVSGRFQLSMDVIRNISDIRVIRFIKITELVALRCEGCLRYLGTRFIRVISVVRVVRFLRVIKSESTFVVGI